MGHRGTNQTEEGRNKGPTEMSKRPRSESQDEDDAETRRGCSPRSRVCLVPWSHSPAARQRCLYLVLDDWKRGYSVHRLDEADFVASRARLSDARPAERPLVRVQARHAYTTTFAAHGSKILAMLPERFSPGIPVFDTETLETTVYPLPRSWKAVGASSLVHASVGDRLVSFVFRYLDVLGPEPPPSPSLGPGTGPPWSWTGVEPLPEFDSRHVSGYALHPDGRTIFMSIENWKVETLNCTFALDTERLEWTRLGDWLLPFRGRGHYDRELDAWVGMCRFKEGADHLCCCDVPPASGCKTMPAWKLGKDALLNDNEGGSIRHSGATLVHMGDSRFCVIESLVLDYKQSLRGLRITSFGLKYDKDGELVTAQYRAYASISYQTVHKNPTAYLEPVAFWM